MELRDAVSYFVEEKKILACMSAACGTKEKVYTALGGQKNESGEAIDENSLFDLASLTKLFTAFALMRLMEEGRLDPDRPVTFYEPRFRELGRLTVGEIMRFSPGLRTHERVDAQSTREEALRQLFSVFPVELPPRPYNDLHAMVLKYVLEAAAGMPMMDCLRLRFLNPLGLTHTFCQVPEELKASCVSSDREHRIEGDRWILREGVAPGTPHDPKARVLNLTGDDCPGHAGIFSTVGDLSRLCQALLRGEALSPRSLEYLSGNRTRGRNPDGSVGQCLGSLCFIRHPVQHFSEIPVYMGDRAFGISGFTGCRLALDPERGIFVLFLGSRVQNRLSVLLPPEGKTPEDFGLNPDGTGQVLWPDGERIFSSVKYVYQTDAHFHPAVTDTLRLK